MKTIKRFFFIVIISLSSAAYPESISPLQDDFTPDKISAFFCSLKAHGEYYRAYVELLRLRSYYPETVETSVFDITSNYLFFKSGRYNDIVSYDYSGADKSLLIPMSLFGVDSLIRLKRLDEAALKLGELSLDSGAAQFSDYLGKRSLYISLIGNSPRGDRYGSLYREYDELSAYSAAVHSSVKNPLIGALAGVFPGMGYFYAGESGTGVVTMIIVGAGSAVTFQAYREKWDSMAVISGLITFFFYGGSIAGGYMQTVKYNEQLMSSLEMRLNRELMPERDLEEIYLKFGLNTNDCR